MASVDDNPLEPLLENGVGRDSSSSWRRQAWLRSSGVTLHRNPILHTGATPAPPQPAKLPLPCPSFTNPLAAPVIQQPAPPAPHHALFTTNPAAASPADPSSYQPLPGSPHGAGTRTASSQAGSPTEPELKPWVGRWLSREEGLYCTAMALMLLTSLGLLLVAVQLHTGLQGSQGSSQPTAGLGGSAAAMTTVGQVEQAAAGVGAGTADGLACTQSLGRCLALPAVGWLRWGLESVSQGLGAASRAVDDAVQTLQAGAPTTPHNSGSSSSSRGGREEGGSSSSSSRGGVDLRALDPWWQAWERQPPAMAQPFVPAPAPAPAPLQGQASFTSTTLPAPEAQLAAQDVSTHPQFPTPISDLLLSAAANTEQPAATAPATASLPSLAALTTPQVASGTSPSSQAPTHLTPSNPLPRPAALPFTRLLSLPWLLSMARVLAQQQTPRQQVLQPRPDLTAHGVAGAAQQLAHSLSHITLNAQLRMERTPHLSSSSSSSSSSMGGRYGSKEGQLAWSESQLISPATKEHSGVMHQVWTSDDDQALNSIAQDTMQGIATMQAVQNMVAMQAMQGMQATVSAALDAAAAAMEVANAVAAVQATAAAGTGGAAPGAVGSAPHLPQFSEPYPDLAVAPSPAAQPVLPQGGSPVPSSQDHDFVAEEEEEEEMEGEEEAEQEEEGERAALAYDATGFKAWVLDQGWAGGAEGLLGLPSQPVLRAPGEVHSLTGPSGASGAEQLTDSVWDLAAAAAAAAAGEEAAPGAALVHSALWVESLGEGAGEEPDLETLMASPGQAAAAGADLELQSAAAMAVAAKAASVAAELPDETAEGAEAGATGVEVEAVLKSLGGEAGQEGWEAGSLEAGVQALLEEEAEEEEWLERLVSLQWEDEGRGLPGSKEHDAVPEGMPRPADLHSPVSQPSQASSSSSSSSKPPGLLAGWVDAVAAALLDPSSAWSAGSLPEAAADLFAVTDEAGAQTLTPASVKRKFVPVSEE